MNPKEYWGRFRHLIRVLVIWLKIEEVTANNKLRFLLSILLLPVKGRVIFLGKEFISDNKLALPLMPEYVPLVHGVTKAMNVTSETHILDIGSNVGQFAFTWLSLNRGSCISFEPNPYCWKFWEDNKLSLGERGIRWQLVRSGVGEEVGTTDLNFVPGKSAQGSISVSNATHGLLGHRIPVSSQVQIQPVNKSMLISLGLENFHFDLVKVDVEGAEISAIKGLREISFDYILVEVVEDREFGSNAQTIKDEILRVTSKTVEEVWSDDPIGDKSLRNILFQIK
jgi:FkbM family methyltransferase